jgi:hypothetical protein
VIGDRIDDFSSRDRFAAFVLGILGASERVAAVAPLPPSHGGAAPDGLFADFFLGIISVRRTLAAHLACDAEIGDRFGASDDPTRVQSPGADHSGLLR